MWEPFCEFVHVRSRTVFWYSTPGNNRISYHPESGVAKIWRWYPKGWVQIAEEIWGRLTPPKAANRVLKSLEPYETTRTMQARLEGQQTTT